jgi:hypothetical protein
MTNVYWLSYHDDVIERGYWDQGLLEDIFKQGNYNHHRGIDEPSKGGIVIINGRTHTSDEDIEKINKDIAKLKWVLFIVTGDEEALFEWRKIGHKLMRVWIMLPRINQHDDVSFHLPQGYRPETRKLLKEIGRQEKTQDWFFAGQVTHERRFQCRDEITFLQDSSKYPNGTIIQTCAFGQEKMPYKEYLENMAKSKIVLCPSGPETPDSFRLYEALEAGCIPVVDQFASNNKDTGFWKYLFGSDIPFPILDYWDALPTIMPYLLKDYTELSNKCFAWWQQRKMIIKNKLEQDVRELSR